MQGDSGRQTTLTHVALIDLNNVHYEHNVPHLSKLDALRALIPIIVSIVMCACVFDWYSISVILVGILASGFASMTIGSGKLILKFDGPTLAQRPQPGDGTLVPVMWEDMVVVVKGADIAVNVIMKGKFGLELHAITRYSVLHILKFLAQLFIPQGTPFGQPMFIISLCVSCAYNFYTSLLRIEKLQADILFGDP